MLASQNVATPPRVVPVSVDDAKIDDVSCISDHARPGGAAGVPEVGNQHTAAPH